VEASERFLEKWKSGGSGVAAGGTMLLEEGMHFVPNPVSAADNQYVESRQLSLTFVGLLFGVPAGLTGSSDRNLQEQVRFLTTTALAPYMEEYQARLNKDLVPQMLPANLAAKTFLEVDVAGRLEGDPLVRTETIQRSVGGPWRTPNEARRLDNLPAVAGGDVLYQPSAGGSKP
jgi:HK97 family phage portal protein